MLEDMTNSEQIVYDFIHSHYKRGDLVYIQPICRNLHLSKDVVSSALRNLVVRNILKEMKQYVCHHCGTPSIGVDITDSNEIYCEECDTLLKTTVPFFEVV